MQAQHFRADQSAAATGLRPSHESRFDAPARRRQRGSTAIEYGLIITLIAIALIGGMTVIGDGLGNTLSRIAAAIS
jgi:pilus assembly protein Flp/PilA